MSTQLDRLSAFHLDFPRSPTGSYGLKQLSSGAAYTVFSHGEFEYFLESWAKRIIDRAERKLAVGKTSRALAHLLTFRDATAIPSQLPNKDIWTKSIREAIIAHRRVIDRNHGIREENVCRLLIPLGYDVRNIDSVLLADLDAFGSIRGSHAHSSAKEHLGQIFDPFDRKFKVDSLLGLLKILDEDLRLYLYSC